jgi:peptide/nickel transport system substrate-binding protein
VLFRGGPFRLPTDAAPSGNPRKKGEQSMRTKKLLAFVSLSAALTVAGCAGSSSSQTQSSTDQTQGNTSANNTEDSAADNTDGSTETSADSTQADGKIEGGSIVVGIQQDFDTLDPHLVESAGTREVLFNIYEGLVKPDSDGNLVGAVAESYDVSADGTEYTFHLREGVKFHNGDTVTAEDVKYSLDRAAGKLDEGVQMSNLDAIDRVEIEDESTVNVYLTTGDTEFIAYMTAAIIPEGYDDLANNPVGTGPFKFVSYTAQDNLVMEKNTDYYGDQAYLDEVTFKIIADADSSVLLALQSGIIDIYPYLTADQADQLTDDYNIEVGTTNLVQALFLNNDVEPFDNELVRQALCYLIDPQEIIDMVGGGYGSIIGSGVFPGFGKYYDADLENAYTRDVEKAKELLTEAGYPDGFSMTISVPSNYQYHMDTAQVIVEQLKEGGIDAEIDPVEWGTWVSDIYVGREYQSTIVGLDAVLAPKALLGRYDSESSKNFVNFSNEEYDEAIRAAIASTDDDEKVELYTKCQELLSEHAASVYLQDPASLVAVSKKLAGYTFYPLYVQDMAKIYFVE